MDLKDTGFLSGMCHKDPTVAYGERFNISDICCLFQRDFHDENQHAFCRPWQRSQSMPYIIVLDLNFLLFPAALCFHYNDIHRRVTLKQRLIIGRV